MAEHLSQADLLAPFHKPLLSQLKAYAALRDGRMYQTSGYNAAGVGAARYRYSVSSVASVNGGSVIAPDSGVGRLLLIQQGPIDVTQWSADPTGVADSTAAIQAAMNSTLVSAGGTKYNAGSVYIPAGTYKITASITLAGVRGLKLYGDCHEGTILLWSGSQGPAMFEFTNCRECHVHDFTIRCSGQADTSTGLALGISQYRLTGSTAWAPTGMMYERINFDGVRGGSTSGIITCFQDGGQTGYSDLNNDFTTCFKCRFVNYRDYGIYLRGSQNYYNDFISCYISAVGGLYGVYQGLRSNFTWTGGFVGGCANSAFYFDSGPQFSNVTLRNFTAEGCARFIDSNAQVGGGLIVEDVRWTGEAVASDGKFINLTNWNGTAVFRDCIFRELHATYKLLCYWAVNAAGSGYLLNAGARLDFERCKYFQNTTTRPSAPEQDDGFFPADPPTKWLGNFIYCEQTTGEIRWSYPRKVISGNSATPRVDRFDEYRVNNAGATVVTDLLGGHKGQQVLLIFLNGNTTIQTGGNILLNGAANFAATANDILLLRSLDGTTWVEICRSVN